MTGYIRSSVVILYTSMPPSNQYQYDLNEFHSETFTVCVVYTNSRIHQQLNTRYVNTITTELLHKCD